MSEEFIREQRYVVVKVKDAKEFSDSDKRKLFDVEKASQAIRIARGKNPLECVVVEHDWPEYEIVWRMLEDRMMGKPPFISELANKDHKIEDLVSALKEIREGLLTDSRVLTNAEAKAIARIDAALEKYEEIV